MKHRSLLLTLAITSAVAGAPAAMAGAEVGSWYVSPRALYVDPDKNYRADEEIGGSLAFGKVLSQKWDGELAYVDSRHDVIGGGSKLKLTGAELNFNRVFMRDNAVSPFIGLGLNSISSRKNGTGATNRDFGAAIKAGVLADLTSNGALQLSAEVGKRSDDFTQHLEDIFAGVGLRFNFGAPQKVAAAPAPAPVVAAPTPAAPPPPPAPPAAPPPPPADDDKDGVPNAADRCPRTPAGDKVDSVGCGLNLALEVQFETNSATIKPDSTGDLDAFAQFMKDVPSVKGELQGHTDSVGKDAYNLSLSQRRAESVKAYIVAKGVAAARIDAKGYGETKPVADNATVEGKAANRRVVFVRSDALN